MNIKYLYLLILFHQYIFAQIVDEKWLQLLHYKDRNTVVSSEFFVSSNNPTPEEELSGMLNLLNSKEGYQLACNFPARYLYIKDHKNFEVPTYNLNKCESLNNFLTQYKADNLNIVFSSEYTNNPSSAFGHTMILLEQNNKSLESGDVIHFAANTSKEPLPQYIRKGLTGQYKGYFASDKFFKKMYEYNTLEQRYMYIYKLDLSEKQIQYFLYHLYELRKAEFKYYFIDGNCATQTLDILNIVTEKNSKYNYLLPIEVVKEYEQYIIETTVYTPLIFQLKELLSKMTVDEKKLFYTIINTTPKLDNNKLPNIVKEALVKYTTFNFRLFHKSNKNYMEIMNLSYTPTEIKDNSLDPIDKPILDSISISTNNDSLHIEYKLMGITLDDLQSNIGLQQSEVKVLGIGVDINDKIKVANIDLLSIKSYPNSFDFYKPVSWQVYLGLNRNNLDNSLQLNTEFGKGISWPLFGHKSYTNLLLGHTKDNIYLEPSVGFTKKLHNKIKYRMEYSRRYYDKESYSNVEFNSHYYHNFNTKYFLKYISNNRYNNLFVGVQYNF